MVCVSNPSRCYFNNMVSPEHIQLKRTVEKPNPESAVFTWERHTAAKHYFCSLDTLSCHREETHSYAPGLEYSFLCSRLLVLWLSSSSSSTYMNTHWTREHVFCPGPHIGQTQRQTRS